MRKYLLLISVLIIIVVGLVLLLPKKKEIQTTEISAEINSNSGDITISDWIIKTYKPYQRQKHFWHGTAHHEIHGYIYVDIFFELPKYVDTAVTAKISIDGIGPLRFGVILSSPTRQHSDILIQATRKYLY